VRFFGFLVGSISVPAALAGWVIATAPSADPQPGIAGLTDAAAETDPRQAEREALSAFAEFAALQSAADFAYLAYYHDNAAIHLRRLQPDGSETLLDFHKGNWAGLQRHRYSASAGKVDAPAYSRLAARSDGAVVIIEGKRSLRSEGHTGAYKAALMRDADGKWKIVEEWLESKG
jgi:ketosteroid isomerase-like protein